jgi:hypothetical protein
MTRRGLLGTLAALVASATAALTRQDAPGTTIAAPRWGPVDLDRHRVLAAGGAFLHVLYRGQDVTSRCYFADDTGDGVAKLFLHRDGRPYLDPATRNAAKETVYGVTLVAGAPPDRSGRSGPA